MKPMLFVQTIALQLTGRLDAFTIGPTVFVKLVKTFPIAYVSDVAHPSDPSSVSIKYYMSSARRICRCEEGRDECIKVVCVIRIQTCKQICTTLPCSIPSETHLLHAQDGHNKGTGMLCHDE